MARLKKTVMYQGDSGNIECVIDLPSGDVNGWALVLHPHPLQGGTRDNKVVTTIARACVQSGLIAVRPNFRGVGDSQGEFDHGAGETTDMLSLISQFAQEYPEAVAGKWLLGGFSFGTAVAAQVYSELNANNQKLPNAVVLAGSAVQRFQHREISLPDSTLLVHGELDEVVPLSETMNYARSCDLPVVVVPDAGHFFHGKLIILRGLVERALKVM